MELSHLDVHGAARMVDVSTKEDSLRRAVAHGVVRMNSNTLTAIRQSNIKKGDVVATARIAGILAAKRTSDLIPLCHPLLLSKIGLDFSFPDDDSIEIKSEVVCYGVTGVEMEALTAVSVAALTVYDMVKAIDKDVSIENIYLESKEGGKSGRYERSKEKTR